MSSFKNFGLHLKNNSISPVSITGHLGIFANSDQVSLVNSQGLLRDLRTRDLVSDSVHISGSSYFKGTINALGDIVVSGNEAISGSLKVNSLTIGSSSPYSFPTSIGSEGTILGISGGTLKFISNSSSGSYLTQSSLTPYALISTVTGISGNLQSQITSSNSVTGSYLTVNSSAVSGSWLIGSNLEVNGDSFLSGSTLTSNLETTGDLLVNGNVNISGSLNLASNLDTKGTLGFRGYNVVATSGTFLVTPDMLGKIIHLTGPSNILLPQSLNFNGDHYSFKAATNQASVISGGSATIDTLETIGLTGLAFKEVYFYGANWFTK
jgi:cytoskeletal protein CcmA (bactofilin family)